MTKTLTGLLVAIVAILVPAEASALITGGTGNEVMRDPGWPGGTEAIFNHTGRVAWWEGPPFGGGQWHAECRGDAKALNAVLADFAKLDVKSKRLVVHDGVGHSFWLAPNREQDKLDAARIDWIFMVWQAKSWERLRKLPSDLNPTGSDATAPPSQIDVFTANIKWADVVVPQGIEVVDQRLEAHGFQLADGVVIEGRVTDLATKKPLAATMKLQRVEPQKSGGYLYPVVAEVKADTEGHWVLKKAPAGWIRVVLEADGYVPRVAGYVRVDEQPQWKSYDSGLAHSVSVAGKITDESGKPLADVQVRLDNVEPESGGRYESPVGYTFKTDAEGRFIFLQVPTGKATVRVQKPGYCRPGLGLPITMPKSDIELQMKKSSDLVVTIDFTGKERPKGYIVEMEPEGGNVIGSYGGSGNINEKNQMSFKNVPPGKYILKGHPNPSSGDQNTESVTVDLKGGEKIEVQLKAK
jgi:hypothetical protein